MPIKRYRRLSITVLALMGTALGATSGYWLGRATLIRSARGGMSTLASSLLSHADDYGLELLGIEKTFSPSPYPHCSDQEISLMQSMTFRSLQVKEIGRIQDGKLTCSAFLGRMDPPITEPPLTMMLPNGTKVYLNVPLKIANMAPGTILEMGGVGVVLSPNAFEHWSRPHVRFMVFLVNHSTGQTAQIAGDPLPGDHGWVFTEKDKLIGGELYTPRCSDHSDVCVVTAERTNDMLSGSLQLLLGYCGLGGFGGFGLGLAAAQFYLRRVGLFQQLRRAIRKDAVSLVYQPILELPSRRFVGAEALVRWSDEDRNPVAPDFFVRIAEDKGFIGELTAMVVRKAARELGGVLRQNPEFTLSINIAASDLEGEELLALLDTQVRQAGIHPRQITLELTERSTSDTAALQSAILRLHAGGYQIHIDDFGTGFSSLSYLQELAVDAIKIDRSFTRTRGTDAVTASILPQILGLAESLRLGVIVEGVETQTQLDFLESTGKPMWVQGWFFGRPVAAAELIRNFEDAKVS